MLQRNACIFPSRHYRDILNAIYEILRIENQLHTTFGVSHQVKSGTLKIATSLTRSRVYLPKVISEFNSYYPAVNIITTNENMYREQELFSRDGVDIVIGHAIGRPAAGTHIEQLFEVEGCMLISDKLLRTIMPDRAEGFVATANGCADVNDFPPNTPIALTGNPAKGSWLYERNPLIKQMPCTYVAPEHDEVLIDLCLNGKALVFLSRMYVDFLYRTYLPSTFSDIHVFYI